jgi:hypothetical protein
MIVPPRQYSGQSGSCREDTGYDTCNAYGPSRLRFFVFDVVDLSDFFSPLHSPRQRGRVRPRLLEDRILQDLQQLERRRRLRPSSLSTVLSKRLVYPFSRPSHLHHYPSLSRFHTLPFSRLWIPLYPLHSPIPPLPSSFLQLADPASHFHSCSSGTRELESDQSKEKRSSAPLDERTALEGRGKEERTKGGHSTLVFPPFRWKPR